jgi:uncharacterized membrane protein YqiK
MYLLLILVAVFLAVAIAVFRLSNAVVYIPNNRVGLVEKLWGSASLTSGLIALNGEVGYQPQILRGGVHMFFPFKYRVHKQDLVTIPQGEMGYIFARDGATLEPGQTLARSVPVGIEDTAGYLRAGGQKGPQRLVLREGTYAINLAQFAIITKCRVHALSLGSEEAATIAHMGHTIGERSGFEPVVIGGETRLGTTTPNKENAAIKAVSSDDMADMLGVVTIHDGPSLPPDEIVAPKVGQDPTHAVTFHNNFQNIDAFLAGGGARGRQHQVLVEGTYYLNRLFATVEMIPKTIIPVGFVGVVVSYIGELGTDRSGKDYSHGELVDRSCRGVWEEPLAPGKYAFNTFSGKVQLVPTTNFILKWAPGVTAAHKFDENLVEVSLITKDAFEPLMPLSVVVHIDYRKAPMVVQRFGDIKRLVDQTLDPMVSAYFKNIGQTKTLIELLQDRSNIQQIASEEMSRKFLDYNLELQEVLIGTPHANPGDASGARIDTILNQLRDRQVATEQVATYHLQEESANKERTLREARARTEIQSDVTRALITIEIRENEGRADVIKATKQAEVVGIAAGATRQRLEAEGQGRASAITAVGEAEGRAIRAKSDALTGEGARLQTMIQLGEKFADSIKSGNIALVPRISVNGGGASGEGLGGLAALFQGFLATHLDTSEAGKETVKPALSAPDEAPSSDLPALSHEA